MEKTIRRQKTFVFPYVVAVCLLVFCPVRVQSQVETEQLRADPVRLYNYAVGLYERKFYDMALTELNRFAARFPKDSRLDDVVVLKINCLLNLGRSTELLPEVAAYRARHKNTRRADELGLMAGDIQYNAKKYVEAAELFRSLIASKTQTIQEHAIYFLAQCDIRQGRKAEAINFYKVLAGKPLESERPYRVCASAEYANILQNSGSLKEALAVYMRLAAFKETPPATVEAALYAIGKINYQLKQYDKALASFEECIAKFPKGTCARAAREFRISLVSMKEDYGKAAQLASEWRNMYPDVVNHDIDFTQAYALFKCKRFNEALPLFLRVGEDTDSPAQMRMEASYYSIYCQMMVGHFTVAEKAASSFIATYPRSTLYGNVLLWHGQILVRLKRDTEAAVSFRKAAEVFSEDKENYADACESLVALYVQNAKWVEAAAVLRKMAANPISPEPQKLLLRSGAYEMKANRVAQARLDYMKVATNTASIPDARIANKMLMQIFLTEKDYKRALNCLAELRKNCPPDELADLEYGTAGIFFQMEDYASAQKSLRASLASKGVKPEQALRAKSMLARICLRQKQYSEALPLVEALLAAPVAETVDLLSPELLDEAGDAFAAARKESLAEKCWRRVLACRESDESLKLEATLKIARQLMGSTGRMKEAAAMLSDVVSKLNAEKRSEEGASVRHQDVLSLLAETQLSMGETERAVISAEKALNEVDGDVRSRARSLYVLAHIRLKVEKRPELANQFATQCYILLDDPIYSPRAMIISMESFLAMGKPVLAKEVFKELNGKYPSWLAEHPDVNEAITNEIKTP